MKIITYANGLHQVIGRCSAIETNEFYDSEDSDYGYYTILDDDATGWCITLNLPKGMMPANQYPEIGDMVIVMCEGVKRVDHPQHEYVAYAEICRVTEDNGEIKEARETFESDVNERTIPILPQSMTLEHFIRLYDALDCEGKEMFVKECVHAEDREFVKKYICAGFYVPSVNHPDFYVWQNWSVRVALEALEKEKYIGADENVIRPRCGYIHKDDLIQRLSKK